MSELKIYQALIDIMKDVGSVGKDKKNAQQGFSFRGVDDAMNATHDPFAKHGVFVVPQVIDRQREERQTKSGGTMFSTVCRVKYTFYASDGSSVEAIIDGEGMDTADKSTSKAQAIAFKYALFQVLDIPTEEMPDPDATTPEPTKAAVPAKAAPKAEPKPGALSPEQRNQFQQLCKTPEDAARLKQCIADLGHAKLSDVPSGEFNRLMDQFTGIGLPFDLEG